MRVQSPAKVNLSLKVGGKMPDGFHWVETLMVKIDMMDELEIAWNESGAWSLSVPGYPELENDDNLIFKACRWFATQIQTNVGADIVLHKTIPMGAGLGGGSSNAGVMLQALNQWVPQPLDHQILMQGARELGADVPFFATECTWAHMDGRGDQWIAGGDAPSLSLVVVCPGVHCNTGQMYQRLSRAGQKAQPKSNLLPSEAFIPNHWRAFEQIQPFGNDFAAAVNETWLASAIHGLLAQGALHAQLSGSGSAVFGLFEDEPQAQQAANALGDHAHAQKVIKTVDLRKTQW
jgi:4-diphosphocytidyl-2-C-methyl-D-erythritol kinase